MTSKRAHLSVFMLFASVFSASEAGSDTTLPSKFTGAGSIVNTRHNLTQQPIGTGHINMNPYRNNYNEICVYCHTPHGANSDIKAPLWNRTLSSQTYTTYDSGRSSTLTSTVNQPGMASMTCLSCHDGTLGIDSVINMPGSGKTNVNQATSQNNTFLNNSWTNTAGPDASVHLGLKSGECLACHSSGAGFVGAGATDFTPAAIGTDLTDEHPVGIDLPVERPAFNLPSQYGTQLAFYDVDGDEHADKNEIRYYKTGSTYRVECASCHDPHGVPSGGAGSPLIPTFLRKTNDGSAVCLTCHNN